jgi:hypothetical protein
LILFKNIKTKIFKKKIYGEINSMQRVNKSGRKMYGVLKRRGTMPNSPNQIL